LETSSLKREDLCWSAFRLNIESLTRFPVEHTATRRSLQNLNATRRQLGFHDGKR
jgi:hypothetical protein